MRTKLAILLCFLYITVTAEDAPEVGLASVYSAKFQGKITASGEQFDHQTVSASHRSLPFGTLVRVTRVDNGKSIVVRINDRGPFVNERITDLSLAAAHKLGMSNNDEVKVRVEELNKSNSSDTPVSVMPESRGSKPTTPRRQNQSPQGSSSSSKSDSPAPKQEPLPELTPKSIRPRDYHVVPNSTRNYSSGTSQKKSLR